MKQIPFALILLFAFCLASFAQTNESKCPQIHFVLPNEIPFPEKTTIFEVKVGEEQERQNLSYEWIFSKGKILRGQGSSRVEFLMSEEDEGTNMEVSVKVIGLPKDCPSVYSDIYPIAQFPIVEPLNYFGKLKNTNEYKAAIDSLFIEINENLSYKGLIVISFRKNNSRSYRISYLKKIREIINFRKYDINRLIFAISEVDSEERTVFWLIPPQAEFPKYVLKENYTIIKGEELKQKLNKLFQKK